MRPWITERASGSRPCGRGREGFVCPELLIRRGGLRGRPRGQRGAASGVRTPAAGRTLETACSRRRSWLRVQADSPRPGRRTGGGAEGPTLRAPRSPRSRSRGRTGSATRAPPGSTSGNGARRALSRGSALWEDSNPSGIEPRAQIEATSGFQDKLRTGARRFWTTSDLRGPERA